MTVFTIGINTKNEPILFELSMANRHGLIAGATGTGKTVTMQMLIEHFSKAGVAVFTADVKGDLSGLAAPAQIQPKLQQRITALNIKDYTPQSNPVIFWDVYGKNGHPLRAMISDIGPLLLGRLLELNDTQQDVLHLIFSIATDEKLPLINLEDLRSIVDWTTSNAATLKTKYGTLPHTTLGIIQRKIMTFSSAGGNNFFGEPALNIQDFFEKDPNGQGFIHILDAVNLISDAKLYSAFLLWLLSALFKQLPEVGDRDKPKLVFFFDEAHLLFNEAPKLLLDKIEQLVRLIRSKGVGVFFVTQSPLDIPETVLGQLSNRLQHALRAYTPKDQKSVKVAAQTFRKNPQLNTEEAITQLGVGEALVSCLDLTGTPMKVQEVNIYPPSSRIGPLSKEEREKITRHSPFADKYENAINRESAFEILNKKSTSVPDDGVTHGAQKLPPRPRGRPRDSLLDTLIKSGTKTIATQVGRQLVKGLSAFFKKNKS